MHGAERGSVAPYSISYTRVDVNFRLIVITMPVGDWLGDRQLPNDPASNLESLNEGRCSRLTLRAIRSILAKRSSTTTHSLEPLRHVLKARPQLEIGAKSRLSTLTPLIGENGSF